MGFVTSQQQIPSCDLTARTGSTALLETCSIRILHQCVPDLVTELADSNDGAVSLRALRLRLQEITGLDMSHHKAEIRRLAEQAFDSLRPSKLSDSRLHTSSCAGGASHERWRGRQLFYQLHDLNVSCDAWRGTWEPLVGHDVSNMHTSTKTPAGVAISLCAITSYIISNVQAKHHNNQEGASRASCDELRRVDRRCKNIPNSADCYMLSLNSDKVIHNSSSSHGNMEHKGCCTEQVEKEGNHWSFLDFDKVQNQQRHDVECSQLFDFYAHPWFLRLFGATVMNVEDQWHGWNKKGSRITFTPELCQQPMLLSEMLGASIPEVSMTMMSCMWHMAPD